MNYRPTRRLWVTVPNALSNASEILPEFWRRRFGRPLKRVCAVFPSCAEALVRTTRSGLFPAAPGDQSTQAAEHQRDGRRFRDDERSFVHFQQAADVILVHQNGATGVQCAAVAPGPVEGQVAASGVGPGWGASWIGGVFDGGGGDVGVA